MEVGSAMEQVTTHNDRPSISPKPTEQDMTPCELFQDLLFGRYSCHRAIDNMASPLVQLPKDCVAIDEAGMFPLIRIFSIFIYFISSLHPSMTICRVVSW